MRIDEKGQWHPDLSDLVTVAGIMHMTTCSECLQLQIDRSYHAK
jgi:hypothetical protein